jgi:hypothetical protein
MYYIVYMDFKKKASSAICNIKLDEKIRLSFALLRMWRLEILRSEKIFLDDYIPSLSSYWEYAAFRQKSLSEKSRISSRNLALRFLTCYWPHFPSFFNYPIKKKLFPVLQECIALAPQVNSQQLYFAALEMETEVSNYIKQISYLMILTECVIILITLIIIT